MHTILQPEGWAKPVGYANGIAARGRQVFVGGQVGWNGQKQFETDDFAGQVRQTLANVVAILREAGAGPEHITTMTWYFTDKAEYLTNLKGIGLAYREVMGGIIQPWPPCRWWRWSRTAPRWRSRRWRWCRTRLPIFSPCRPANGGFLRFRYSRTPKVRSVPVLEIHHFRLGRAEPRQTCSPADRGLTK